jgi:hypothetical protein
LQALAELPFDRCLGRQNEDIDMAVGSGFVRKVAKGAQAIEDLSHARLKTKGACRRGGPLEPV